MNNSQNHRGDPFFQGLGGGSGGPILGLRGGPIKGTQRGPIFLEGI